MNETTKIKYQNVWGPYQCKNGWFRVSLECLDGAKTEKHFRSIDKAKEFISEVKTEMHRAPTNQDYRPYDGTLAWFSDVLGLMTYRLVTTRDKELRQDLKSVASAALSAKNLVDVRQMEDELMKLREKVQEVMAYRKHGLRIQTDSQGVDRTSGREVSVQ